VLLVLLAAGLSRCALPALCPTDAELIAAIAERNNLDAVALELALGDQDPGSDHMVWRERVLGVDQVHCGALPNRPQELNCSFTVRYHDKIVFQVAKLSHDEGRWTIENALSVTRYRRGTR